MNLERRDAPSPAVRAHGPRKTATSDFISLPFHMHLPQVFFFFPRHTCTLSDKTVSTMMLSEASSKC